MKTKKINGRKFDIDKERALSFRDKAYYARFQEFKPHQFKPFIDYLMSGIILDWEWNLRGGYNDLDYVNAKGEKKTLEGNHGVTEILQGIDEGRWNPSDVLHDFAVFYQGCNFCDESSKEERQKLYQEIKVLIQKDFSVELIDHSGDFDK